MARGKTRKLRQKNHMPIEHHHLLLRLETETCPQESDKEKLKKDITHLIHDISMNMLSVPHTYYMKYPRYNEGLTGVATIKTSHVALHFWRHPDPVILHNEKSKCLLQMDIYTCGKLTPQQIFHVLKFLEAYKVTHADITLLNRKWSLTIEKHEKWDIMDGSTWTQWIHQRFFPVHSS